MPIHQEIRLCKHARVILWEITEDLTTLENAIAWHTSDRNRYQHIHHIEKKKEFLALRLCLKHQFGVNPEVFYTSNGKPFLKRDGYISFSHTKGFAGLIISKSLSVGIDLEHPRPSILRVAPKFARSEELKPVEKSTEMAHLIFLWGVKECVVKITGNKQLSFKNEIRVSPFTFLPCNQTTAVLANKNKYENFTFYLHQIGNLFLTYGWKLNE